MKDCLRIAIAASEEAEEVRAQWGDLVVARIGGPSPLSKLANETRAEDALEKALFQERKAWERVGRELGASAPAVVALRTWAGV